jgi:hypothetical protein
LNRSSLPGLTRQSILFRKKMDARVKPAHDGGGAVQFERDPLLVPLHSDFDRLDRRVKVARAGVSDQRALRCCGGFLVAF